MSKEKTPVGADERVPPAREKKFGFVALIGPPNAGKSTLMNQLVGQKVAITSRKPQTTRHRILGIKTTRDAQAVFVDTPGIHDPGKKQLNKVINKTALNSLEDVDLIIFMIDDRGWGAASELALAKAGLARIDNAETRVILVINKIDRIKDKQALLPVLAASQEKYAFSEVIPLSAKSPKDVANLWAVILGKLPEDELGYGFPADQVTDKSKRFLASELVREQLFRQLGQELPYSIAVEVNQFEQEEALYSFDMIIWVDRKGQKGIIVGKGGEKLKQIGKQARIQMEQLFGNKVYLSLWVKVRSGWADNAGMLRSLGYMED